MKAILAAPLALLLAAQTAPRTEVSDLAWMTGRWLASENGRWTEEVWEGPRGGTLMGFSWSGEGSNIDEYEYLRIQTDEDGEPMYLASPRGGAATGFYLARADATSATFENPDHDFPQRIVYRRDGEVMVATISAMDGSNARSWTYRRQ
jgi:Domain of unknown function (DUF6265)